MIFYICWSVFPAGFSWILCRFKPEWLGRIGVVCCIDAQHGGTHQGSKHVVNTVASTQALVTRCDRAGMLKTRIWHCTYLLRVRTREASTAMTTSNVNLKGPCFYQESHCMRIHPHSDNACFLSCAFGFKSVRKSTTTCRNHDWSNPTQT